MENNKLITLLKTLSKEEFRLFARFVRSPLHNRHEGVIRLFTYLREQIEGRKGPVQQEKVMARLFPDQPEDVQQLHYLSSYLLKVAEEFLAWAEWKNDQTEQGIYLMRAYQKHGLEKSFLQTLKKTREHQDAQVYRNVTYFRQWYQLQVEEYNYSESLGRVRSFNLQELSQIHEEAFIAEKLKNACILLSHQAVTKTDYDTGLLEVVLAHVETRGLEKIPAIGIYYHGYRALTNIEEDRFFVALKELILRSGQLFTLPELRDIHILAINCCIRRLNLGKKDYLRETFDLYRVGLDLGVLLTNEQLSPWTYSNIIVSGLKLGEFDWVYQFIFAFKKHLPENHREGFFNYNLARYYFEQGDYRQAMPLLMQMEYDDLLHNLSAKTMLSKMYYELQELDALDNLLSSFKTYIYRKKVLGYHRENYLNFIGYMHKLIALKPYADAERKKLKSEILQSKVTEQEWLLGQLEK